MEFILLVECAYYAAFLFFSDVEVPRSEVNISSHLPIASARPPFQIPASLTWNSNTCKAKQVATCVSQHLDTYRCHAGHKNNSVRRSIVDTLLADERKKKTQIINQSPALRFLSTLLLVTIENRRWSKTDVEDEKKRSKKGGKSVTPDLARARGYWSVFTSTRLPPPPTPIPLYKFPSHSPSTSNDLSTSLSHTLPPLQTNRPRKIHSHQNPLDKNNQPRAR